MRADSGHGERADWVVDTTLQPANGEESPGPASGVAIGLFVVALARALHAFVTYPIKNPARGDVVQIVRQTLHGCGSDEVVIQVTNDGLRHENRDLDSTGDVVRNLVLLLRRTYVAALQFDTSASERDIAQFCELLAEPEALRARTEEFSEILKNRGVTKIDVHVIGSHETIEAGVIPEQRLELIAEHRERRRNRMDTDAVAAEGGWVRVDPTVALGRLDLSELPLVLPDATRVAVALRQLNGRRRESMPPDQALAAHYQHVAALYESVEPDLADALHAQLADSIRSMPAELKDALLRDELLPALVDGDPVAQVITQFSDEELVATLPELLELGIGGVEMLSVGLSNLDLPESRRSYLAKQLAGRVESGNEEAGTADGDGGSPERIRALLTLDSDRGHQLSSLSRFDLSVDEEAAARLEDLVRQLEDSDPEGDSLRCHTDLVALCSDPSIVTGILRRSRGLFSELESRGCVEMIADAAARYATIATDQDLVTEEIASLVNRFLTDQITPAFLRRTVIRQDADSGPSIARILNALGHDGADLLVATLQSESDRNVRRKLLMVTRESAGSISSGLVAHLGNPNWFVVRNVLMVLGYAGPGFENSIADSLTHENPKVVREALLALARIGSGTALAMTVRSLGHQSAVVRRQAADAIWRFPPEMSHPAARDVIADHERLLRDPELGRSLIRGGRQRDLEGLPELVRGLTRWRFALWDRRRMALGREAQKAVRNND